MSIYEINGKSPKIGETTYIHETAQIIGDVIIGEECFIGAGAVLRGDFGSIRVGDRCSVQESCTLHCRPGEKCVVGNDVTVGHGAVLHGCTVKDRTVIGMHAVVSDYATVGEDCIVGESSLVKSKQEIPAMSLAVGVPAVVKGALKDNQVAFKNAGQKAYVGLTKLYKTSAKKISD
ncbi:MAG TPA: gamma carbonic anhydrase family protein [bacterium]|nr:gamma carbonic anhydrase family protein [bacterium]